MRTPDAASVPAATASGTYSALYRRGRRRICDLASTLGDDGAAEVPACPGWTVHDVIAHLVGVSADIVAGNLGGVASAPWTAVQVETRRDRSLAELVDEWSQTGPQLEMLASRFSGRAGEHLLADIVVHEHDIRGALGRAGARDAEGVRVVFESLLTSDLTRSIATRGLGALVVRADGREWVVGSEPPAASVEAPAFELFRAVSGRRSANQICAYAWTGDPEPYIAALEFGPFVPSAIDIVE